MPSFTLTTFVPAEPGVVYAHVTGFPSLGQPDPRLLEDKYGSLEGQDGMSYTFREKGGDHTLWQYTFDPPQRREARNIDSNWSDRTDTFEASGNGTTWTISWTPKAKRAPLLLRWLLFQWKDRQRLHGQIVQPVLDHFRGQNFY